MEDQVLTPHFKLSEFIKSSTAKARGIDNSPTVAIINNLRTLCERVLEPFREEIKQPVIIGSGYRCPQLNAAVGGVKNSQHMTGEAADIHLPQKDGKTDMTIARDRFRILMDGDFDQVILETADRKRYWIHVSCKSNPALNRHHAISFLLKK